MQCGKHGVHQKKTMHHHHRSLVPNALPECIDPPILISMKHEPGKPQKWNHPETDDLTVILTDMKPFLKNIQSKQGKPSGISLTLSYPK
ncbi:hypothetical protein JTB14_036326 [Gonioctena quinquepunctata]|nr:hypothetical protein JTB14_036326 [Gonioctena quinquepunctata]